MFSLTLLATGYATVAPGHAARPSTADRDRDLKRRLYQRQGVADYWIVDPDTNAVDVWRFGDEPRSERFVDSVPVRLESELLGQIDLEGVFAEGLRGGLLFRCATDAHTVVAGGEPFRQQEKAADARAALFCEQTVRR